MDLLASYMSKLDINMQQVAHLKGAISKLEACSLFSLFDNTTRTPGYQVHLYLWREKNEGKFSQVTFSGAIALVWLQLGSTFAQTSVPIDTRNSSPACNNM